MEGMTGSVQIISVLAILAVIVYVYIKRVRVFSTPPSGHNQVLDNEKFFDSERQPPKGALKLDKLSSYSELGFEFASTVKEYRIQLKHVPDGVTPYLLDVSAEENAELQKVYKDGFESPVEIAGNLVFVDEKSGNLVKIFKSPIELTYNYFSSKPEDLPDGEKLVVLPVFLYTVKIGDQIIRVWKPFQISTTKSNTIMVNFQVWGDMQFGVGTLKVPHDYGP